jgi:hypothetical protein
MIKDKVETTNTVFLTENDYQIEMTNGWSFIIILNLFSNLVALKGEHNHLYVNDSDLIKLENGKKFTKSTQIVYPKQFTDWMHG